MTDRLVSHLLEALTTAMSRAGLCPPTSSKKEITTADAQKSQQCRVSLKYVTTEDNGGVGSLWGLRVCVTPNRMGCLMSCIIHARRPLQAFQGESGCPTTSGI